jgi:hypothetical protein
MSFDPADPKRRAAPDRAQAASPTPEPPPHYAPEHLKHPPPGFRGEVVLVRRETDRRELAMIVAHDARFMVLESSPELRALSGRTVAVAEDAQGRLHVHPDRDRSARPAPAPHGTLERPEAEQRLIQAQLRQEGERRAWGDHLALTQGGEHVRFPMGFRGRVEVLAPTKGGQQFARVRDDAGRFALVPATAEARALHGRLAQIGQSPRGDLQLQPIGRDRGR